MDREPVGGAERSHRRTRAREEFERALGAAEAVTPENNPQRLRLINGIRQDLDELNGVKEAGPK